MNKFKQVQSRFPVLRGNTYYLEQADLVVLCMLLSELYEAKTIAYLLPAHASPQEEFIAQIKSREGGFGMKVAQRLG